MWGAESGRDQTGASHPLDVILILSTRISKNANSTRERRIEEDSPGLESLDQESFFVSWFMGSRKRSKLNPKAEAERKATPPSPETDSQHKGSREPTLESVLPSDTPESAKPSKVPATEASTVSTKGIWGGGNDTDSSQLQSGGSWYGRTWPRGSKANPVTQVVKESISAAGGKASEAVASARARTPALPTTPLKSPAVYLSRSIGSSSRSLPLAATTTKLNITSGVTIPAHGATRDEHMLDSDGDRFREHKVQPNDSPSLAEEKTETTGLQNRPAGKEAPESLSKDKIVDGAKTGNDSASWLSWFSKAETARDATRINAQSCSDGDPTNGIDKYSAQNSVAESHEDASPSPKQRRNSEPNPVPPMVLQEENPRYWLGLWSNATAQTKTSSFASATGIASNPLKEGYEPNIKDQNSDEAKPDSVSIPIPLPQPENVGKSYNWAFWSRDQPRNENGKQRSESTVGETVVAGSQSQSEPGNAVINETGGVSSKAGKMQRSYLLETADKSKKLQITDDDAQNVPKFVVASEAPKAKPDANAGSKAKRLPDNLLLPSLKSTYKIEQRPSLIQQISRLFPISSSSDPPKHVNIMQCQPRIKRALAIVRIRFQGNCLVHG